MPDFTAVMAIAEMPGAYLSVIVESDDHISAVNAAAAQVVLAARRGGQTIRPEELTPVAVYAGKHVELLGSGR